MQYQRVDPWHFPQVDPIKGKRYTVVGIPLLVYSVKIVVCYRLTAIFGKHIYNNTYIYIQSFCYDNKVAEIC